MDASHEVVAGVEWEVAPAGVLDLGVLESVMTFENSPDSGVHVGFAKRLELWDAAASPAASMPGTARSSAASS